jgi:hypothetical protein
LTLFHVFCILLPSIFKKIVVCRSFEFFPVGIFGLEGYDCRVATQVDFRRGRTDFCG